MHVAWECGVGRKEQKHFVGCVVHMAESNTNKSMKQEFKNNIIFLKKKDERVC